MLTAALLEILPEREKAVEELNGLGIPGVTFVCGAASKCGIRGTHISVKIHGEEESEKMHEDGHVHEHEHGHGEEHQEEGHDHGHTLNARLDLKPSFSVLEPLS